jgi:DNA-directed RNA polymerase specialized sigma24 family protein
MAAFRQFDRRRPAWEFRPWVYRIATFTCFNFNRRHAASPKQLEPSLWSETIEEELQKEYTYEEILRSPSRVLEQFEPEIVMACRELNDNERAILLLRCVGGFSCAEIASIPKVLLGTSQGLLTR